MKNNYVIYLFNLSNYSIPAGSIRTKENGHCTLV